MTTEIEQFRASVRSVIAREILPNIDRWEREGFFDAHELFPKLAQQGLLGLPFAEADGGGAAPMFYQMALAEELARNNFSGVALAINVQMHMATPSLARHGTQELKERFLRPAIEGRHVAAIAVTEPDAGSDVAGITARATRDGDDWLISGTKTFITNGAQADWYCMLLRTSEEGDYRGMSQIIVPRETAGFEVVRTLDKLGNRSSDTAELRLENVRVPVSNTIGEIGRGFQQQMQQFVTERVSSSFSTVGACAWALGKTREYLELRHVFHSPLAERQYPVFQLTELSAEVDLLRALNEKMCRMFEEGKDITREATVAKLTAGRLGRKVADTVMQFHGGLGYLEENWTGRFYRDIRLTSIGAGADEVMLQVLARLDGFDV